MQAPATRNRGVLGGSARGACSLPVVLRHASVVSLTPHLTHSWRGDVRRRDGGKRSRFASRGRRPEKPRAARRPGAAAAVRVCRGTRARRSRVSGNATDRPYSARPPRHFAPRGFSCDRKRPSLRLAARDLLPPSGDAPLTRRDERTGQVAAAGRWTRHVPATDGNRVRKRSGHAAPDSTMALGLAVSRDDCWLSPGSPQAACASSARALEDTVAMPAVPGPRTRLARCGLTRRRTWRRLHRRQRADRASSALAFGPSRSVDFSIDFAFGLQPITQLCAVLSSSSLVESRGHVWRFGSSWARANAASAAWGGFDRRADFRWSSLMRSPALALPRHWRIVPWWFRYTTSSLSPPFALRL